MSVYRNLLIKNKQDKEKSYLTFTAAQANSAIKLTKTGSPSAVTLYYKLNDSAWTTYNINQIISLSSVNNKVAFKGTSKMFSTTNNDYYKFVMSGKIKATGQVDSLINYSNLTKYCYKNMFNGCTSLTIAPELPATALAYYCYESMFYSCTSLTTVPELPASTLTRSCYSSMFAGCTSLSSAPKLPASTLASYCYYDMFADCTSLSSAPKLPASTLASYCYYYMFYRCKSLTTAPELPATNLAWACYQYMFCNCTSLSSAPELPATNLANYCYCGMFSYCSSLTIAPGLPASTLADHCYTSMFYGCTRLTTAPELPATTLADYCYYYMLAGCSSLITMPELPATTLETACYYGMFNDCTNLTDTCYLPASSLVNQSYKEMFSNCTNLSSININFTDWNTTQNATKDWLSGVANIGKFTKPNTLSTIYGNDYIPSGWTVIEPELEDPYLSMPITLETLQAGNTITLNKYGSPTAITCYYKVNDGDWTAYTVDTGITLSSVGDKVSFKCDTTTFSKSGLNYYFSSTKTFNAYGNIMSLVQGNRTLTSLTTIENDYQFYCLFYHCTYLIDAQNLKLPATTLTEYCYQSMFSSCSNLIASPTIFIATNLKDYCYNLMFMFDSNLTNSIYVYGTATNLKNALHEMIGRTSISEIYLPNITKSQFINSGVWLVGSSGGTLTIHCSDETFTYTWSCFPYGTKINMADGSVKNVEDLTYDDVLKVWDFDNACIASAGICWLTRKGLVNDHYYKLTFSDGTVLKTTGQNSNHKVYNVDQRYFKGVDKTEVGDRIYSLSGIVTVTNKQYIEEQVQYMNLITTKNIDCFAEGILTSDRYGNMYTIDENMQYVKDGRQIRPYSQFENVGISAYWYDNLRLGELTESLSSTVEYINKLESQMEPITK